MAFLLAGIDEAGYGPLLGPLCVGMAAVRIDTPVEDPAGLNLWKLLKCGVCTSPDERRGRVAVADSKALKLANTSKARHPLAWLERGVLAFLRCRGLELATDVELFDHLGVAGPGHRCYEGDAVCLPLSWSAGQIAIAANMLNTAMAPRGVSVADVACVVVGEGRFNETVSREGSKARTTVQGIRELAARLMRRAGETGDRAWLVCDRLGGRARYVETLAEVFPHSEPEILFENERESRYRLGVDRCELTVSFTVEGESAHLPTALASMTAKFVRELHMIRFNRYWCGLRPGLKPTAGYRGDAQRWLDEAAGLLSEEDRRCLVRIS